MSKTRETELVVDEDPQEVQAPKDKHAGPRNHQIIHRTAHCLITDDPEDYMSKRLKKQQVTDSNAS
jgi:hypothetical protein